MKYYIIAGEASGDLHGSNLIKAIRQIDPDANIRAWGGDMMHNAGAELVKHYRDLAFMGFWEVLRHLPTIMRNLRFCKTDIIQFAPDVLVLIDYPGFNLRIASFAQKAGLRVVYYISPQVWAWKESRVAQMHRDIDQLLLILPFEKDFFAKHGWTEGISFVGHPLLDVFDPAISNRQSIDMEAMERENKAETNNDQNEQHNLPIIAFLPGSREQEVRRMLPEMLQIVPHFEGRYRFVVAGAPALLPDVYDPLLANYTQSVSIVFGKTYQLLAQSSAAIVTSGTATLETALCGVPQVVCYKGNAISYQIAKRLVKVSYISLVNLILDAPALTELVQNQLKPDNLRKALENILPKGENHDKTLQHYADLRQKLGGKGASVKAAAIIVKTAKN